MNQVEICNMALLSFGAEPIQSLKGPSIEAVTCNILFPSVTRSLLTSFHWSCCISRYHFSNGEPCDLNPPSGFYSSPFLYRFDLPPNFLLVVDVTPLAADWSIEGDSFLCSAPMGMMRYMFDTDKVNTFPQYLCDALAAKLAMEICYKISGRADLTGTLQNIYNAKLNQAILLDATQGTISNARRQTLGNDSLTYVLDRWSME